MTTTMAALSENTVVYKLFPTVNTGNDNCSSNFGSLEKIAENYISRLSGFLSHYIWQNDCFNLHVVEESTAHLKGITCFEDNIEDEWFIVYLLFYLTEKYQDLVVQIQDNDGEFLLIEAAEYVPKWLNPDTSENRVFIYQGSLHIIPIASNPSEITPIPNGVPSVSSAVSAVRQFSSVTKASTSIQQAIKSRIEGFPHKIDENKHRAHCYVPCAVAAILKEDPNLLPAAVKAFYLRDPIDLKACRAMKYFAPETRVMTEVVFTKCLYAQIASQKYEPDKRTGWNLPAVNSPEMKAHDLGMKLACGFEILASNAEKMMVMDDTTDHDFNNDVRWRRFASSLKEKGYFRGEIEGTMLYQRLLLQAKNFYLSSLKKDSNGNMNPGLRVRRLLETLSINYEEMKEAENWLRPPDDDSWMEITPEALDSILEKMSQKPNEANVTKVITDGLKSFVHHRSDIEGVEVPESSQKSKKQKINFDPDAFADAVNTILDFRIPGSDDEKSSSSMSGYSDDDDDDISLDEQQQGKKNISGECGKVLNKMKAYMDQMDKELSKTDVGLSFERLPPATAKNVQDEETSDINDEEDDFQPVDINLTALKNILESYSNQQGMPGPASNLFSTMGVQIPDDLDS